MIQPHHEWLFGCAATPVTSDAPKIVSGMVLTPYDIRDDCVRLSPGDRLDYTFNATEPVAFEIRYREGAAAQSCQTSTLEEPE
jgi:hypothetical protein